MPDYDADNTGKAPLENLQAETPSSTDTDSPNTVVNLPGLGLQFDPAKFLQYVEEEDLTEEQAGVLLRAIWDLVVSFVDLGFGLSPVQQALVDRSRSGDDKTFRPDSGVLSSKDKFTEIANMKPDGRTNRVPAAPEES